MPTDTNLPTIVTLYLELINKLLDLCDGLDSASPEVKLFNAEIKMYLDRIAAIMDELNMNGEVEL